MSCLPCFIEVIRPFAESNMPFLLQRKDVSLFSVTANHIFPIDKK